MRVQPPLRGFPFKENEPQGAALRGAGGDVLGSFALTAHRLRKRHPLGANVDVANANPVLRPEPSRRNAVPSANSGHVLQLRDRKAQQWRGILPPNRDNVALDLMDSA
jgi:hypothetical protein